MYLYTEVHLNDVRKNFMVAPLNILYIYGFRFKRSRVNIPRGMNKFAEHFDDEFIALIIK